MIQELPVKDQLTMMRQVAASKVAQANGSLEFFHQIEANINVIATAGLSKMAPVNHNLLGFAMILMAEINRLRNQG